MHIFDALVVGERAEAIAMPTAVGDPLSLDAFASRLQLPGI